MTRFIPTLNRWLWMLAYVHQAYSATFCTSSSGEQSGFCLYSQPSPSGNEMDFKLVTYEEVGWVGFGFGFSMHKAETFATWLKPSGQVALSRRACVGHRAPPAVPNQDFTILESSTPDNKTFSVTFRRSLRATDAMGTEVHLQKGSSNRVIIAYSDTPVKNPDGSSLQNLPNLMHPYLDTRTVNLFAAESAFSRLVAAPGNGNDTKQTGTVRHDSDSAPNPLRSITLHGLFMFFGWCIFAPFGITISRYFKGMLGVWWFRGHVVLMLVGVAGCTGYGYFHAYEAIGGRSHFNFSPALPFAKRLHVFLGLLILLSTIAQSALGFYIDYTFDSRRHDIPTRDKAHWWIGRVIFGVAWLNIFLGLMAYDQMYTLSGTIYFLMILWTGVWIWLFWFLERVYGVTHHVKNQLARSIDLDVMESKLLSDDE